jgi:hypothetical protein
VENNGGAREATDDNIIWRMHFVRWITKAADSHSEHVIIIAFPLQHWFRECTSMLRYTYIACLVFDCIYNGDGSR